MHISQTSSVTLPHVKAHLLLMAAFLRIYQTVEKAGVQLDPATGLPIPTSHAVLSLARSLKRFEAWITTLNTDIAEPGLKDYEIPPLDVLMFLHAYMLNPLDFYEDSIARHKVLTRVGEFPLSRVVNMINKDTLELVPTREQTKYWETATAQPFEIPFVGPVAETFAVGCPRCAANVSVPWEGVTISEHVFPASVTPKYPFVDFQTKCETCKLDIDQKAIRMGRFLQDINGGHVAHTVLDSTGAAPDSSAASVASLQLLAALGENLKPTEIADLFDWNIERTFEHIRVRLDKSSDLYIKLSNIEDAYSHSSNFSVDLSDAVFRQARFVFQMSAMGWLDAGRFNVKDDALVQAMSNYEHFLRVNTDGMIVRWDVDLIFHTHQLLGPRYRNDTLRVTGRVLDHDDKQPQDVILRAAELAEAVWKDTFGQSYLVPHDPGLLSTLAKTVCGGSSGGACVSKSGGGNGGNGNKGGGKRNAVAPAESNEVILVN